MSLFDGTPLAPAAAAVTNGLGSLGMLGAPKAKGFLPADILRAQQMAAELQKDGTQYSPIGSPLQGVARIAEVLAGNKQAAQAMTDRQSAMDAANASFSPIGAYVTGLGGAGTPTPMSEALSGKKADAGPAPSAAPQQTADAGGTFDRMLGAESNGQQFNGSGGTLTSPKGALGMAQIMPATAPEAAGYAGLPYDADKLANDPGYNKALGQAYYNHQLETFGDPAKAAAAYNAGPGALQGAMAKAQQNGGSYLDYLPAETQAYVAKVSPQQGGAIPDTAQAYAPNSGSSMPSPAMGAITDAVPSSQPSLGGGSAIGQPADHASAGPAVTNNTIAPTQSGADTPLGSGGAAVSTALTGSTYPGQAGSTIVAANGSQADSQPQPAAPSAANSGTLPYSTGSAPAAAPPSSSGQQMPTPAQLLAVMTNPWATPAQQQIASQLYAQQAQRGKYTQSRDADGSLIQHDNFTNETKVLQDNHPKSPDVENYRIAKATGFAGSFGDYILGVKKAQAPMTQTNIDQRGESAESSKSGEFAATRRNDMLIAADKAPENISRLQLMGKVLSDTQTGPLAGDKGTVVGVASALGISPDTIKSLGLDPNQAVNNQIAQKLSNELVAGSIGAKGGGFPASNFSVAERQFIEKMFPNIASQPGSNAAVNDVLIAREQRNLDKSDAWQSYKNQQRQAGKPLSYEDFEGAWQQGHATDNIFGPIAQKFQAGGYSPNGAPLPAPTSFGTFGTSNTQQSTGYQAGAIAAARDAIAKGAPRDAVMQRLQKSGVDISGAGF
jgi:hypothetical protein